MFFCSFVRSGLRGSDPNGVVKVVGLGTDHRLSLAQNHVLLAGQIAILLDTINRDVARLRKRRQVAGREEVRAGDSQIVPVWTLRPL